MSDLFNDEANPEWLDTELWKDFIENRTQIRKPLTEVAKKRMLRKLERFHASGIDVNECLERSIINRWQDIYEPDRSEGNGSAHDFIAEHFKRGYRLDLSSGAQGRTGSGGPERKH